MQEHLDNSTIITITTTVGTVLTGALALLTKRLQREARQQTQTMGENNAASRDGIEAVRAELQSLRSRNADAVKLLITSREDIVAIRGELAGMHAQGTDAGIRLAAQLTAEMAQLHKEIAALRSQGRL